jgi:hypothetical protein
MIAEVTTVRHWCSLDLDAFATDLLKSELFCASPQIAAAASA